MSYYDPVSQKEIDEKVPQGKFRVISCDTADWGSRGIYRGDFDDLTKASNKAQAVTQGEKFTVAYIWDDQGILRGQSGDY